ncbi:MAG: DUF167 domain-containing protein [Parcubacteria group bacterium]|nr:DUF167 domain-containing protein [Parcubacteria group bacterium]
MYIRVNAIAGAKKESVKEIGENRLEIAVREPAERNMANKRITELVAAYCGVPPKAARIINGHHSPHKMFSIHEK